jgi:phosphoglycerate dehydrogenase-like enzyme
LKTSWGTSPGPLRPGAYGFRLVSPSRRAILIDTAAVPAPVIALHPGHDADYAAAVEAGGGRVATLEEAQALVLWQPDGGPQPSLPAIPAHIRWVQLPAAGVERWLGEMTDGPVYTSAAGAFALPVAEHALALMLAGARSLAACARAERWNDSIPVRSLEGATVAIVGAGGIGRALIRLLAPLNTRVLAVTRHGRPVAGADLTVAADRLDEVLAEADHVVLAAPGTASTRRLIDAGRLARMKPGAWLVNVGRGSLVDTDALVRALEDGTLGGAALDVTDPEPLPEGHPLWRHERVLITPHVASTIDGERRHFAQRVRENVARFAAGEPLLGVVDRDAGY